MCWMHVFMLMCVCVCVCVCRLRSIRKELLREEEATRARIQERLAVEREAQYHTRRLGKQVYPPPPPPPPPPSELGRG